MSPSISLHCKNDRDHLTRILTPITIRKPNSQEKIEGKALWDTGATQSCIDDEVVKNLNLEAVGTRIISAAGNKQEEEVSLYTVDFYLKKDSEPFGKLPVIGTCIDSRDKSIIALVGMDIIHQGSLSISYEKEEKRLYFDFCIPSLGKQLHIDFEGKVKTKG